MIKDVMEEILIRGYDCYIDKEHNLVLLKDGFVTLSPVDNIIKLREPQWVETKEGESMQVPGVPLIDVVELLIGFHKTKKDIEDGLYD